MKGYRAVCIGINYKNTQHQLYGCINDANDMKALLVQQYGYAPENIRILCDEEGFEQPTRRNILDAMSWVVDGMTEGSKSAFTYSGHGYHVYDQSNDESDRRDEVICALDGFISDDEINSRMLSKVPQQAHLTCMFDCCHSGTVADLMYNFKCCPERKNYTMHIESRKTLPGNCVMFSGCYDPQTSMDIRVGGSYTAVNGQWKWESGRACGAFTHSLLTTLKSVDYKVQHDDLLRAINDSLKQKGYEQISQFSCSKTALFDAAFEL